MKGEYYTQAAFIVLPVAADYSDNYRVCFYFNGNIQAEVGYEKGFDFERP